MKLDKRITDIDTIQTCLKYDVDSVGRKGFFFDEFCDTTDLSKCRYGELIDIVPENTNDLWFKARLKTGLTGRFRFFIQEDALDSIEKHFRPYTMSEFKSEFKINTVLTLRKHNEDNYIYQTVYLGNRQYDDSDSDENDIYLSQGTFSLKELFNIFEIVKNGDWQPFGVEV